jgi:amidase
MYEELTISGYHSDLRGGRTTASQVVGWYLNQIATHNDAGARLQAIVTTNPTALEDAAALDEALVRTGNLVGPLHGVPVIVKDQAETAGLRTTFGSKLFEEYIPTADATVVAKLRAAGAIILAKTTMCDLAAGWFSSSSMTDHTKNAYDRTRDSGGSSAGSGAGVAANFGLVGVGEDTGGSIRIPASFNNVFGLRVTTGLVSRTGFSPLVHFQDTPGPMARTVDDLARLLDVLVGFDPKDPYTAVAWPQPPSYEKAVADAGSIDSWRIGVLETGFGSDSSDLAGPVNQVVRSAIAHMASSGLDVVPDLRIDGLSTWIAETSVYLRQSRSDIDRFLASRPDAPVSDFKALYRSGVFHPENDLIHGIVDGPDDAGNDAECMRSRIKQDAFRRLVANLFASNGLDFLVYPSVQVIPPTHAALAAGEYTALTFPTNTVIGSQAGMPALSMPAGFTKDGLPIGMEVLGLPHSEHRILQFAAAWEQLAAPRKAPQL